MFGKVTCVEVDRNQADVTAELKRPAPGGATHIGLHILDNGNPVNGISPDLVLVSFTSSPGTEPDCVIQSGFSLGGESRGNAIVRDDA